ncbi:MAG: glucose 1-dehydrogenase [Verrucomicrobia bacterium]|nr:glucose 1-dehydrogenase [Verrucomicrobiota bacterium]
MSIHGKVGIVTGGASGIGKEMTTYLAAQGCKVVIMDVQKESGSRLAQDLTDQGHDVIFLEADVSKEEDHIRVMKELVSRHGKIDFACNNAGIEQKPTSLIDLDASTFDRLMQINLKGVWLGMKHQIRQMLKHKKGCIVNTASIAGINAVKDLGGYNAVKAGVIMLTRTAALEYAPEGIRVNSISPGLIETEMAVRMKGEHPDYYQKNFVDVIPMKRPGYPIEIAKAVAFLCSDGVDFMTGHNLVVDGGWCA